VTRGLFGPGTIVLGGGAVLLVVLLAIGFFLPTEWEASAELQIEAAPADLMTFLDSPEGWRVWTEWPDSGLTRTGPDRGTGARIGWNDRELGSGSFTIGQIVDGSSVQYEVSVDGAANTVLSTYGLITMLPAAGGTLVRWAEEGDLGSNPLMGYWARSMAKAQSVEMTKGLDRLSQAVHRVDEAPADSMSTGGL
jgi:hypothetical protein